MEEMIWTDDWICIVSKEQQEEKERKLEKLPVREGTLHYRPSEHKMQNTLKYQIQIQFNTKYRIFSNTKYKYKRAHSIANHQNTKCKIL